MKLISRGSLQADRARWRVSKRGRWLQALKAFHHGSLFWRFFLIGIATLAPLVLALLQFAGDERRLAITAAQERAELLVSYSVEGQEHALKEARAVLRFLAAAPEARAGSQECQRFLLRHVSLHDGISSLRLSNPDGSVACSDGDDKENGNLASKDFFQKALQGAPFVLSELGSEGKSGALAMIAAVPVIEGKHVHRRPISGHESPPLR